MVELVGRDEAGVTRGEETLIREDDVPVEDVVSDGVDDVSELGSGAVEQVAVEAVQDEESGRGVDGVAFDAGRVVG